MVNLSRLTLAGGGVVVDLSDHLDRLPLGGSVVLDDGLDGLGLPPVAPRFFEGAGDGATYRGARVQPRDIALPLLFTATDRETLRSRVSALATALSPAHAPAVLTYREPDGKGWTLAVVRTGSGTPKTDGETFYSVPVTLRAPDPFWTAEAAVTRPIRPGGSGRGLLRPGGSLAALRLASGQVLGDVPIENPGDAPAYPVTTLTGPATDFTLRSALGEVVEWKGDLEPDEVRIFDHRASTVVDGAGKNCYAELGPAPRFWAVPPGVQTARVEVLGSALGSPTPTGDPLRTNLLPNPSFQTTTGYTATGGAVSLTASYPNMAGRVGPTIAQVVSDATSRDLVLAGPSFVPTAGKWYGFRAWMAGDSGLTGHLYKVQLSFSGGPAETTYPGSQGSAPAAIFYTGVTGDAVFQARPGDTAIRPSIYIRNPAVGGVVAAGTRMWTDAWLLVEGNTEAEVRAQIEGHFFDGATPSTAERHYSWVGAANASASVERAITVRGQTSVSIAWRPRRWLML